MASEVLKTIYFFVASVLVPEGPNIYSTGGAKNIEAPEERNIRPRQRGVHCAPLELKTSSLSTSYKHLTALRSGQNLW